MMRIAVEDLIPYGLTAEQVMTFKSHDLFTLAEITPHPERVVEMFREEDQDQVFDAIILATEVCILLLREVDYGHL
jgi:hypothetical protein